jgi:hypothetical protein
MDALYVWATDIPRLESEIGPCLTPQGVIDLDLMKGCKAEAVREIVRAAWELSLQYLIVLPLVGMEQVAPFLVDEKATDRCRFPVWVRHKAVS